MTCWNLKMTNNTIDSVRKRFTRQTIIVVAATIYTISDYTRQTKWNRYLSYCKVGYLARNVAVEQIRHSRRIWSIVFKKCQIDCGIGLKNLSRLIITESQQLIYQSPLINRNSYKLIIHVYNITFKIRVIKM